MTSPERYLAAVGMLAVTGAALAVAARAVRIQLLPSWSGAPALLGDVVLGLALLVAVAQIAGVVGLLHAPVVVVAALLAAALALRSRTAWPAALRARDRGRRTPWRGLPPAIALVGVAVGALAVLWLALTFAALDRGMLNQDSVWYHLPLAGRFAQEGSITDLFFPSSDPLSSYPPDPGGLPAPSEGPAFYPATSSLLHALGILIVGHDTLSPLLNLGWLALALLAAWCAGRPAGIAPATLAAGGLALSVPALAGTQPGEALNDVAGVALLLAAAALLLNATEGLRAQALAAVAAGIAAGMKLTFVAPAMALAVGAVWLAGPGARLRSAGVWLGGLVALGGVWFARNLIHTGSPLPLVKLGIGDLAFPKVDLGGVERFGQSVADYAADFDVLRTALVPALPEGFGVVWPLVLALAVAGVVLGLLSPRSATVRMLALVAAVSLVAYLFTPQGAGGAQPHNPGLFLFNMRFATPGIALGLLVLPLCRPFAAGRATGVMTAAFAAVALVTLLGSDAWPDNARYTAAAAVALALGGIVVAARGRLLRSRRLALSAAAALVLLGGVAGWLAQDNYLDQRYAGSDLDRRALFEWAAGTSDARVAITGLIALEQYPLFGDDVSNVVEYPGREGAHGALRPLATCRAWQRALADGRYDYVVVSRFDPERDPIELGWTRPVARQVLLDGPVRVLRRDPRAPAGGCA